MCHLPLKRSWSWLGEGDSRRATACGLSGMGWRRLSEIRQRLSGWMWPMWLTARMLSWGSWWMFGAPVVAFCVFLHCSVQLGPVIRLHLVFLQMKSRKQIWNLFPDIAISWGQIPLFKNKGESRSDCRSEFSCYPFRQTFFHCPTRSGLPSTALELTLTL